MMLEDDYGIIDGIINNGSKEEKTSLLDKLQEKKELLLASDQKSSLEQRSAWRRNNRVHAHCGQMTVMSFY